jgi:hypothetical protein
MKNNTLNVDIVCQRITGIEKLGNGLSATIEEFDMDDLFSNWDGKELVELIGKEKLLDAIGVDDVISYFGLDGDD